MIYTQEEIDLMDLPTANKALKKLDKAYDLDKACVKMTAEERLVIDPIANCLIALENRAKELDHKDETDHSTLSTD